MNFVILKNILDKLVLALIMVQVDQHAILILLFYLAVKWEELLAKIWETWG